MRVFILTSHRPAGRMEIRDVYEDEDDANKIGAMSSTMKVEIREVVPSSKRAGHQDRAAGPSSTEAASSA